MKVLRSLENARVLAAFFRFIKPGRAMLAKRPMIKRTIITSMSVKPSLFVYRLLFIMELCFSILEYHQNGRSLIISYKAAFRLPKYSF